MYTQLGLRTNDAKQLFSLHRRRLTSLAIASSFASACILAKHGALFAVAAQTADVALADHYRSWFSDVRDLATSNETRLFRQLQSVSQFEEFARLFWASRKSGQVAPGFDWAERQQVINEMFGDIRDERSDGVLRYGRPTLVVELGHRDPDHPCGLFRKLQIHYHGGAKESGRFYTVYPLASRTGQTYTTWNRKRGLEPLLGWDRTVEIEELLRKPLTAGLRGAVAASVERGCPNLTSMVRGVLDAAVVDPGEPSLGMSFASSMDESWPLRENQKLLSLETTQESSASTVDLVTAPSGALLAWSLEHDVAAADIQTLPSENDGYRRLRTSAEFYDGKRVRYFTHVAWIPPGILEFASTFPAQITGTIEPGNYSVVVRTYFGATWLHRAATATVIDSGHSPKSSLASQALPNKISLRVPSGPVFGNVDLFANTLGAEIQTARFFLDDKLVFTDSDAPFRATLDLGNSLHPRRVAVTGLDAAGKAVDNDGAILNRAPFEFDLELAELPSTDPGVVLVEAKPLVPRQGRLAKSDLLCAERACGRVERPPWIVRIPLTGNTAVAVQGIAVLEDGRTAEDTILVNSPGIEDEVEVRVVELFLSAEDRSGRPISNLSASDLQVRENGQPQQLFRFERAMDLPLTLGVLVDGSATMAEELGAARAASLTLFQNVLGPRDEAAFLLFNHQLEVVVPITADVSWLVDGTSSLRAYGGTALHDAVIYSLYYLGGLKGRRALILVSDGHDESSRFTAEEVERFAQRSGVAVYPIMLHAQEPSRAPRMFDSMRGTREQLKRARATNLLRKLATTTGGIAQRSRSEDGLAEIMTTITNDLRNQYMVSYQSPHTSGDGAFIPVSIRSTIRGVRIRTVAGYYAD